MIDKNSSLSGGSNNFDMRYAMSYDAVCFKYPILIKAKLAFLFALAGFDYPSVSVSGMTLRLSQVFYLLLFIFRYKDIQYSLLCLRIFLVVCIGVTPSLIFSENIFKSAAYIGWLFFNYFIVVGVIGFYVARHWCYVADAIVISFRLQVIFGLVLVVSGYHERMQFLYYEPSYFAIAMILYFSVVLNRGMNVSWRSWVGDAVIVILAIVEMQSATLLIGLLTVVLLTVLKMSWRKALIYLATGVFLIVGGLYLYSRIYDDLLAVTVRVFFDAESFSMLVDGLIGRGGNRVPRIMAAFDIFREHPYFGVGIGAYEQYIKSMDLSSYYEGLPWLDISDKPAVNIFIELLATVGMVGTIPFLMFICAVYYAARENAFGKFNVDHYMYVIAFFGTLFMLNFESNYLRLYLWNIFALLMYCDPGERKFGDKIR